jgi:SDR family mycofactocin-dependent oxidoreductase
VTAAGRVAVVTGAARGIGAATVLALARQGWSVLAVDHTGDPKPAVPYPTASAGDLAAAVRAAAEVAGAAGRVAGFDADVRDAAALSAAVATAAARWGGLDAAIACAGVIAGGRNQWEVPAEQERAVLDIDLGGVLNLARAAVPALLRRPEPRTGRFLAVASAAATRGLPMLAAYCAAKAGVAGLIRALAVELGPTGVTANAVSPGSTATAMLDESARLYGLPAAADFAASQPAGRLLEPDEVAAVLAFLAGAASSGMTGAVVPVDGGLAL